MLLDARARAWTEKQYQFYGKNRRRPPARSLGSRKADVIRTEFVGENNKKQNVSITYSSFFIFKTDAKVTLRDPPIRRGFTKTFVNTVRYYYIQYSNNNSYELYFACK